MSTDIAMRVRTIEEVLKKIFGQYFEIKHIATEEYLELKDELAAAGADVDPIQLNLHDLASDIERALS